MSYCEYINTITGWALDLNKTYHDEKYGFPIEDDNELFGRLLLEINQAGLSWSTILRKEAAFRTAYDKFDIETIANYTQRRMDKTIQTNIQIHWWGDRQ